MAYQDMRAEVRGSVPKMPFSYAGTIVNRAWRQIRESHMWSFNILEFAWISPNPIQAGTVTVTLGSATITFDSTAIAALNAGSASYSLITQRQFRIGVGGIYNIIALDPSFSSNGIATLDRIYADTPSGAGQSYQVYQAYYVPPVKDFLTLFSARNMIMYLDMDIDKTRSWVDAVDPQRSWYLFPTHIIPWGTDQRGAGSSTPSSTLNYPLYELWGQAITPYTYQCYGIRKGTELVNPADTLPPAVGEDCVMALARFYAYEWAEANKGIAPRNVGPDYKFLMKETMTVYRNLLTRYRKQDKEVCDSYFRVRGVPDASKKFYYYSTIAGVAGPYSGF